MHVQEVFILLMNLHLVFLVLKHNFQDQDHVLVVLVDQVLLQMLHKLIVQLVFLIHFLLMMVFVSHVLMVQLHLILVQQIVFLVVVVNKL